jgi:hypothetical protein
VTTSRWSIFIGLVGIVCIGSLPLALLAPGRVDALLRPYGLFVSLGMLAGGVVLPTVAAVFGSKLWLLIAILGAVALTWFFIKVMA